MKSMHDTSFLLRWHARLVLQISAFTVLVFILICCGDWDKTCHVVDPDPDLSHKPIIVEISRVDTIVQIKLDYQYSDACTVILERKTDDDTSSFKNIDYFKLEDTPYYDLSIDGEKDATYIYRCFVMRNNNKTAYSPEKALQYVAKYLNQPSDLTATVRELKGVFLEWSDNSDFEDEYIVEKTVDDSVDTISLSQNSDSLMDSINGIPLSTDRISYRIYAKNNRISSKPATIEIVYSGIATPTNLDIIDTTSSVITLQWQDNSLIETGYEVERRKSSSTFQLLKSVDSNTTKYTDSISRETYYYRVRARSNGLHSLYSNTVPYVPDTVLTPVACYPFNGNAQNECGIGCNGNPVGTNLTYDRFNNPKSAYEFDWSSYIYIRNCDPFDSTFTISAWITPTELVDQMAIISKKEWYDGWYFGITDKGSIFISIGHYFLNPVPVHAEGGTINIDTSNNVVATSDMTHLRIYHDGILVAEAPAESKVAESSADIRIGRGIPDLINWVGFTGIIDDIKIYDQALDEQAIQELYNEELRR